MKNGEQVKIEYPKGVIVDAVCVDEKTNTVVLNHGEHVVNAIVVEPTKKGK
jgi:hypothetical protein